jgi:uncharacterized integral membrane protein
MGELHHDRRRVSPRMAGRRRDQQSDPFTEPPAPVAAEHGVRSNAPPNTPNTPPAESKADESKADVHYEGAGVMGGVVILLIAAVLLVVMVGQNLDSVPFHFLWWSPEVSLALLILITAVVVLVIDQAIGLIWRRRRRKMRQLTDR